MIANRSDTASVHSASRASSMATTTQNGGIQRQRERQRQRNRVRNRNRNRNRNRSGQAPGSSSSDATRGFDLSIPGILRDDQASGSAISNATHGPWVGQVVLRNGRLEPAGGGNEDGPVTGTLAAFLNFFAARGTRVDVRLGRDFARMTGGPQSELNTLTWVTPRGLAMRGNPQQGRLGVDLEEEDEDNAPLAVPEQVQGTEMDVDIPANDPNTTNVEATNVDTDGLLCCLCDSTAHNLRGCLTADEEGYTHGCPWCMTIDHPADTCNGFETASLEEKVDRLVTLRGNMPPYLTKTPWLSLVTQYRAVEPNAPALEYFPWSEGFTQDRSASMHLIQEMLDKSGDYRILPTDPATKDWAAVCETYAPQPPIAAPSTEGPVAKRESMVKKEPKIKDEPTVKKEPMDPGFQELDVGAWRRPRRHDK